MTLTAVIDTVLGLLCVTAILSVISITNHLIERHSVAINLLLTPWQIPQERSTSLSLLAMLVFAVACVRWSIISQKWKAAGRLNFYYLYNTMLTLAFPGLGVALVCAYYSIVRY